MKKILYLTAIAALAIVSCTKDDTKEVNRGRAIDFRVATTRAAETTTDNLADIWVTAVSEDGINHFTDVNFTKDGNYFVTSNAYYWPADGSSLTFYAYAPSKQTLGAESLTVDANTRKVTGFVPAAAIKDQIDFTYAVKSGSKADADTGVELIFDHALTQVEVKALSNNTGYIHKVKGVRLGEIVSKADFDFGLTSWDLGNVKSDYQVEFTEFQLGSEAQSLMGTEGNAMLIPQQLVAWKPETDKTNADKGAYIAILINITTADGAVVFPETAGEYGWIAYPIDTKWIRGFKYVYTFDFTNGAGYVAPNPDGGGEEVLGGKITFTHNISGWSSSSDTNENIAM